MTTLHSVNKSQKKGKFQSFTYINFDKNQVVEQCQVTQASIGISETVFKKNKTLLQKHFLGSCCISNLFY